jgi:hypothetical protein
MSRPKYYISGDEFVIENYNSSPTFASFFPGIAGVFGCPMWVFYANRGQCVTSAGVLDKNAALMEFQPANKAYRIVSLQGFRTFVKTEGRFYEPFSLLSPLKKEMRITPHSLKLVEENASLKLRVEVTYFTIPNESFPALARTVRITNLGGKPRKMEVVDGLPIIIPFGFDNDMLKRISQTIEAWCTVENLENGAPFYKLKILPVDISETKFLDKGNFFVSFCQKGEAVDLIVDPAIVFGEDTSLEIPENFVSRKPFKLPTRQMTEGFTPSAFAYKKFKLEKKGSFEINSLFGQADSLELLNKLKDKVASRAYFAEKFSQNKSLIDDITSLMSIESSAKSFDLYSRNTFLDNAMRGGLPVKVDSKITYLYYRKHGDMERDYNDFNLMPAYFSQGNGNYRDINQNRRNDLFFNPDLAEDNILRFFNLIQLDGFNPLVVLGSKYFLKSPAQAEALARKHIKNPPGSIVERMTRPFVLGSFLKKMENDGMEFKLSREEFAADLMTEAEAEEGAQHGEGFWIDHFCYNLDLLESYESIYPDRIADLVLNNKIFTFYDNEYVVVPRNQKYRLAGERVRQYESVRLDIEKSTAIRSRSYKKNSVRTEFGKGDIYYATLLAKLLCLATNKAASFDAEGIGIEMEADKPDWYDALNGLPGIFGSSLSVTLELKRLCLYAAKYLSDDIKINLPEELKDFMDALRQELAGASTPFHYWDKSYALKEEYRQRTKHGLSGKEVAVDGKYAMEFLERIVGKCDQGVRKVLRKYGNYLTYFINEVVDYELIDGNRVTVKKFNQQPLPLFLEGFVHALKVEKDKKIYGLVKDSQLYDDKLKMYKVNAPLKDTTVEIGRAKIFTPGWLENESVWLHMEYKYLLELLKAGMHREFFADFKNVLVPFMDPARYRRSILENSSFIVSSAHPNRASHGRGFVARLSGGAAEFIDIWVIMTTGKNIFFLDENGKLCFKLSPVLPAWLFNKGRLSFKLLGSIDVTYLNKNGKDTFDNGVSPASYNLILDDGKEVVVTGPVIREPHSKLIRERKVSRITVTLS